MTRFHRFLRIGLLILFSLTLSAARSAPLAETGGRHVFTTRLSGAAEVPGPGDPDGKGFARITLSMEDGQPVVCWSIRVKDILLPATGAHIHAGPAGVAGPIVVPLTPPDESGRSSGCTEVSHEVHMALHTQTDQYYVNVHNSDYPAGAVRGQLR